MQNGFYGFPRRTPKVSGGGLPPDGNYTDVTVSSSGTVWTINNNVVTFAKMQDISTNRLIGRYSGGSGDAQEITIGSTLGFSGSTLDVQTDTTRQLTKVKQDSIDIGTRSIMHYTRSNDVGIAWDITDDAGNSEIDITFQLGSWSCVGNLTVDNILASATGYWGIFGGQVTDNAIETNRYVYWPYKATWRHLYVRTFGSQPAGGALTLTLRVAAGDTAIVATIAAGSAAGSYSDTVNTASSAEGDPITIKGVNAAGTNSATCAWAIANRPQS